MPLVEIRARRQAGTPQCWVAPTARRQSRLVTVQGDRRSVAAGGMTDSGRCAGGYMLPPPVSAIVERVDDRLRVIADHDCRVRRFRELGWDLTLARPLSLLVGNQR